MRRLSIVLALAAVGATAQPRSDVTGVDVREVAAIPQTADQHPIRIDQNPSDGALYVLATSQPGSTGPSTSSIYRLDPLADGHRQPVRVLGQSDHETPRPVGMAFGPDGSLYLVGNDEVGEDRTQIVIRRGTPSASGWSWATVATSAPYLLSRTWFDHRANAIAVTPDGTTLIVNSGARTDHGEMYGGVREEGLTALLLQIPSDATDLVLPNDRETLLTSGFVFAEGIRNTADLAFAPNGHLFGPENAGDRDDSEELNWLREGAHYGFPWRIGTSETPMQFPGYDADADPFVQGTRNRDNQADTGWYFSNDPTYPAPPDGVTFVDPIPNAGPFADRYRDPTTGAVQDASETATTLGTFTAHRSPLGMVFDADSVLAAPYRGSAFVLSFNGEGDGLVDRMGGTGEDLLAIDLDRSADGYTASVSQVALGFDHPIDATFVDGVIYVIEYGNWFSRGGSRSVHAVTLPRTGGTSEAPLAEPLELALRASPNPARGAVNLHAALPTPTSVRVELVDALGRIVRTLPPNSLSAGAHTIHLPLGGLRSGVYVVRLRTPTEQITHTLTVLR